MVSRRGACSDLGLSWAVLVGHSLRSVRLDVAPDEITVNWSFLRPFFIFSSDDDFPFLCSWRVWPPRTGLSSL